MRSRTAAWAVGLVLAACASVTLALAHPQPATEAPWRTFAGNWVVTGQRQSLPTEGDEASLTLQVSGAVVLTLGEGLSRGFRGELIAFSDGGKATGRFVWTDQHGDRIFGRLEGPPVETGAQFTGTFTGGTGRYGGITGNFTFSWQYVVNAEEGVVEGRTVGLQGRYRKGPVQP